MKLRILATGAGVLALSSSCWANPELVKRLLETKQCHMCPLEVANLKKAMLGGANLLGSNLSQVDLNSSGLIGQPNKCL